MSIFATLSAFSGTAFAQQWGEADDLKEFISPVPGQSVITNLRLIDSSNLMSARLSESPWSSDFWPDEKGSIADPYNETGQGPLGIPINRIMLSSNLANLKARASLHEQVVRDIHSIPEEKFDNMAPSEKYDMLLGDTNFTMTNRVIEMVEKMNDVGLVAAFSGVCHGWGPASLTIARPEHRITLKSPLGRDINFYPFDIKALASFLWGKTPASNLVHFEGSKCYSGGKTTRSGRLVDPKCFNINPALFHLVAINQLGIAHKGFLVDRKDDSSVWNHPVYGYNVKYFRVTQHNPQLGLSLNDAKVSATSIHSDPFGDFRAPGTASIVGVEMTFNYGVENKAPTHVSTDDPSKDKVDSQKLRYDLELDVNDNVIGGEWREYGESGPTLFEQVGYTHPNSIWLVPPGLTAYSPGDVYLSGTWDGSGPVPAGWREVAVKYSSSATIGADNPKNGELTSIPNPQALGPVVDTLVKLSRNKL